MSELMRGRHWSPIGIILSLGLAACGSEEEPTGPSIAKLETQAAAPYTVVPLDPLGTGRSEAMDINQAGVVVGYHAIASGAIHAFRWKSGVMTDLGTLGGSTSQANAVNADGVIVGWSLSKSGNQRATRWLNGTLKNLGTLGGLTSEARDISPTGVIVGWAETESGQTHAFRWENRVMTDLGTLGGNLSVAHGINRAGWIVGSSLNASGKRHAFLWKNGVMRDLGDFGRSFTTALGINNQGLIVGVTGHLPDAEGEELEETFGFLWTKGVVSHLQASRIQSINPAGAFAGTRDEFSEEGDFSDAFVFDGTRTFILDNLDGKDPGQILAGANAINPAGDVVGFQGLTSNETNGRRATLWRHQ